MMATQGVVSVIHNGKVVIKVVAGSGGYNAKELVEWIKNTNQVITPQAIYDAALKFGFGNSLDLVVQYADGGFIFDKSEIDDEWSDIYLDESKFLNPLFNPRWECGIVDVAEIVTVVDDPLLDSMSGDEMMNDDPMVQLVRKRGSEHGM